MQLAARTLEGQNARVARAVFVGYRAAEHAGNQLPLRVVECFGRGNHNFEALQMQFISPWRKQAGEGLNGPGVAVEILGLIAVEKCNILPRPLGRHFIGGEHNAVFEVPLLQARLFLLVLRQLDGIAPEHDAAAAGRNAPPRHAAPARGLIMLY